MNSPKSYPIPTLRNGHLVLRPCKPSDYERMKYYRQDEESCKYIRPAESDERIKEIVDSHCQPWQVKENYWNALMITSNDSDEVAGEILFRLEDLEHQRVELGYRIAPDSMQKGLASSACDLLIDYLFSTFKFHKIVAKCDPENVGSYKVMEKVGMVREAYFKSHFKIGDKWTDQLDYGILREDWLRNRQSA